MKYIIIVLILSSLLFPVGVLADSLNYAEASRVELLNEILSLKKQLIAEKQMVVDLRKNLAKVDAYINTFAPHYTQMFANIAILQQRNHYLRQLTEEMLRHPYQPFDIAISLQFSVGTGVAFTPIAKMYFWEGLYGFLGGTVFYNWTGFGHYNIPFALQAGVGLGYDFYWRW
jgi:hypothetical protein